MRWLRYAAVPLLRYSRSLGGGGAVCPRAKYTEYRPRLVVSGLLAWLGLQQSEPEHDLIVTIKRGILAAQVHEH